MLVYNGLWLTLLVDYATFGQEKVYVQSRAEGFIHLYGLSLKRRALNSVPISGLDLPKPDYSRFKRV